ncbi:hypothetical protein GIY23_16800 [Allosaccharopolyspora coralli]|uniref:DUF4439 domain-containing protein n=1 Tax=Allosaccharopolyspora coralli TaxID=2665642 RepID=A0A5Q3QCR5_9PSEU|nr:hypothetical protein GIY23_16800 [Allosaccharopolyspora coralli]
MLGLTALLPVTAVLACTADEQPPDPLQALARTARADAVLAELAAELGVGQAPELVRVRRAHADALQREIDRIDPPDEDDPRPRDPQPSQRPSSAPEATTALTEALRSAGRQAADQVPRLPAHRAGLVGSVSASCASLLEVLA